MLFLGFAALATAAELPTPPRLDDGFPVSSPASEGIDERPLVAMREAVERGQFPQTTSVLIVRDGKLVYEAYFGGGGPALLNDTRSATKSVMALAVGAAIADGFIRSVDDPAFVFLAGLKPFANDGPRKQAITLEDLLTMSSALDCDDNVEESPGNEEKMYPQREWARFAVDLPVKAAYQRDAQGRGPFADCTAGVFLLGRIIERATRVPVDSYVQTRLLAPLDIHRTQWPRSPAGEVMTGGGLRLTSRDLAKISWMVLDGGRWNQAQVLPASWTERAEKVHRRATAQQDYGYLFWHRDFASHCGKSSAWYMGGNGGNAMLQFKDQSAVVVVTRQNYNSRVMHQQTERLVEDYVLKALPCD